MPGAVAAAAAIDLDVAGGALGWHTTDDYERALRRARGADEIASVRKLDDRDSIFGAYRVLSGGGTPYVVEIRALEEPLNSCGCADHAVNGLGTCKHVEGVLNKLRRRRGHAAALRRGNPATELYLDRRSGLPALLRGARRGPRSRAEAVVEAHCTDDGTLIGPPERTLEAIERELSTLRPAARAKVAMSRYLRDWREAAARRERDRTARVALERDLESGRPVLDLLRVPLYPYQREGVGHLAFTRRAILADEMGLGKTIQAIGACELLAQREGVTRVLVVAPASLKGEWADQIGAFTQRDVEIIDGNPAARRAAYRRGAFFQIVNYEQVRQDADAINAMRAPEIVILDEAQRIKNWRTQTATQVKKLRSPYAFVLTGTPLENRIDEIYSIVQFLDPAVFGPLFRFNREFYVLDERGRPAGYRNLDVMHRRLQPLMLRRRKAEVEGDLPARSVVTRFVDMAPEQEDLYEAHSATVARLVAIARRRPLRKEEYNRLQSALACMRMACDTPFILDRETRVAPKLDELVPLLEDLLSDSDSKAVVFSEWERMLVLARERCERIAPSTAWHTGTVAQVKRREAVRRFREDPDCRILFSTDSGGVGLNLQVADVVVNLDLPWNPAKLEQRIARVWRKHQRRSVRVVNFVSEHTIEHRMLDTLARKRDVADAVVDGQPFADAVPLRSGRHAFIERLESLGAGHDADAPGAGGEPTAGQTTGRAQGDGDLSARLADALGTSFKGVHSHRVDDGRRARIVVVDHVDERVREIVQRHLPCAAADHADAGEETPVEVVDASTWEAIQRLLRLGVVRLADADGETADRPDDAERAAAEARARLHAQAERARNRLSVAERRHAMARLLHDGGFVDEALPVVRDSLAGVFDALAVLAGPDEWLAEPLARAHLAERFGMPDAPLRHLTALEDASTDVDAADALAAAQLALEHAARACAAAVT